MEPIPSHGVRDLEALHAIASFGLLVDHIQNEVDRVGTLGVVTLILRKRRGRRGGQEKGVRHTQRLDGTTVQQYGSSGSNARQGKASEGRQAEVSLSLSLSFSLSLSLPLSLEAGLPAALSLSPSPSPSLPLSLSPSLPLSLPPSLSLLGSLWLSLSQHSGTTIGCQLYQ